MARVASFEELADEFQRRWQRTVWATMATVGPAGRLQSRIGHPLWEGPTGWVLTGPRSVKGRHVTKTRYASLTYWDQTNEQVHVECRTEWERRAAEKQRVWNLFRDTPMPLGYDPALFFKEGAEAESTGVLKLRPWRLELWSLADLMSGTPPRVWIA